MWKKVLTISLVLVMILSFAACAKEEVGLPSAQEIVDGVIESWAGIRTYQFDMDMTMDMAGEAEGEAFEATVVTDLDGVLDLENRQMKIDMTVNVEGLPGLDKIDTGIEMYLIGDMVYTLVEIPEMEPMWIKSEMPDGYWGEMSQVEPQIELLEAAQVELLGSEMVGGIDCYVLEVTPDLEQLWQFYMPFAYVPGEVPEESLQEIFQSVSVKQCVAKDTYFLTKVEINMAVELTPEALGFPEEEGVTTMDTAMSLLVYDYNQPVSTELPPEAEEAVEVTM